MTNITMNLGNTVTRYEISTFVENLHSYVLFMTSQIVLSLIFSNNG